MPDHQRNSRLRVMLAQLEVFADNARAHEQRMAEGVAESASWANREDREWVKEAASDAKIARIEAERDLEEGRRIARGVGVDA